MTVSYVSSANVGNINNVDATSVVCNKPTGTVQGDLMVVIFTAPYTGTLTYTAPSGWSLASSSAGDGGVSLWSGLYYKIAGGSEPSTYTWQCSGAGSLTVGTATFRADNVGAWNLYFSHGTGTTGTITQPSSTPSGGEPFLACHGVSWHNTGGSNSSCTSSAGTEIWDIRRTDGSPSTHERGSACYVNGSVTAGGGSDSGETMTVNTGQTSFVSWTFAVGEQPIGAMASTAPHFGSSLSGTATGHPSAALGATVPKFRSSLAAAVLPEGPIACTAPHFGAVLSGTVTGTRVELFIDSTWTDVTSHVRYNSAVSLSTGRTAEGTSMTTTMANFTLDNRADTVGNRYSLKNPNGIYFGKIGRNTPVRISDLEYGYRFHGEVSAWTPGADDTNNDQYVALECSGIVRRLDASRSSVQAAMRREIMANSPIAYWPCDEASGSFASPIAGVRNMQVAGLPTYGDYKDLACSTPFPQLNTSAWHTPTIAGTDLSNGVTVAFLLASPGGITNGNFIAQFFIDLNDSINGHLRMLFDLKYTGTNELTILGPNFAGLPTIVGTVPIVGSNGVLVYVAIDCASSGVGHVGLWYQGETDASPVSVGTDTWGYNAGTTGQISLAFNPYGDDFSNASAAYIGQVAVWDGYGPSDTLEYASVGAYSGEAAGTRFARLCTEEDITHTVSNASNSSAMGPQLTNSLMNLLRECEATDMGIMYELRDSLGLGYKVRRDLYNQDATLELNYTAGDLATQLQPTYDDKDTKNDVTVTRIGGSSGRYTISSDSALSTQDPPDGVGLYEASVSVSLAADSQCYPQAGWRAHLGTVDEERITSLGIGLENPRFAADATLRQAAMDVAPGSRITVSNAPDWTTDVNQIVQGYTERFDQFTHDITYNTSSAAPYITAVAVTTPSTTTAKADSLTSTLHADIDDSATSLVVDVTGVTWRSQGIPIALFDSCDTIDVSKWTINGGSGLTANGQWTFATTLGGSYTTATSATTYDLTGKYHSLQLVSAGNQALASLEVFACQLYKDSNNSVSFYINDGHIFALHRASGSTTISGSTTYNSTTHQWLRIREQSGTTYWDTSPDGITWTNFYSISNPFAVTALEAMPSVGTYDTEASTTTVVMDNIDLSSRPFDIIVGGERMTVTAVSGTTSPQTFTVTRSVNSIVKSHSTGEQVRLYQPAIVGL